ncbi:bifunctional diguanylate cyclase/phosphodiesterase [Micromonospora sp. WMMA1998]|uniref:putative bifunctional diguanylate cyclase/phosphodiesterase n=1 Tax=Micromonospora sp. WMMA1998 TaxID=3015167 RepID=UPI00248BD4D5|nr:bifunctional diguanylate cyclase/phosphodiesterase [Micromonospora sp. WMMA1998]WBC14193.1 bifunctional diguanylate cyclase/phosphodiesterase [Micromonospora sp. WMMA1998]
MSLAVAAPARHPLAGRVGLVAAVVVVLGEMIWLVAGLPGAALVSDLGAMAVSSWAAVLCVGAARRHPHALRRFWSLLAATMMLAALGRTVWTAERLGGIDLPHTPLVGGLFTAGIVTGTAALLCSRSGPRSLIGQARTLLDGVIVGLALIPIGWLLVFRDVADADLTDPLRTFGLLYPMFDLMQLTILVAVAGPGRPMWRSLTVIGAGLAIRAGADTVYVSLVAHGSYAPGHPVDVCWPLSYLLVGLATRYPPPACGDGEEDVESPLPPWWRVALPYLPVGGAIVAVMLSRRPTGQTPHLVFVGMMALLGVLALRQGLAANENLRLVGRLRRLAYSDQLTSLPNRLTFIRRLRRALRAGGPVAVVLLDLDGFKQVNDRFGHAAGDRLLTTTAERMRDAVGPDGMIARLGGDEFAVLVAGERPVSPERLAVRLLAALEPLPGEEDLGVHPSASIGIAEYGPQHTSHTDLLRDADIAMYAAKASGKSAYRTCTAELRESAVGRAELIADLRRAVDEGQLLMEFQPIVDLATGTVRSAEALVRWRHPRLGVLTPARFLPLAEETGLILGIDRWVIHEACRAAATWREHAPEVTVAVNIAAAHLCRPDLIATVTGAMGAAGLPPRALTLELTESALIEGSEAVLDRLAQLRDLGVRIAIDDFGTGYSSLSYLHRIPATELKIDRSFVSRLDAGDARAYATVEMVNRLAGAFDLAVVAEGVETGAQHAAVTAIGCRQGQGWRYGRPTALSDLLPTLVPVDAAR